MTVPVQPVEHVVRLGSRRGAALRGALVVAISLIIVAGVAATASRQDRSTDALGLAAGASASATTPDASAKAGDRGKADGPDRVPGLGGRWGLFERSRNGGGRGITITAISGDRVSLKTVDGWTRTIQVTADTAIRKDGAAAKVGDLEVGDAIRLKQRRNGDGSFTVVGLTVPIPVVAGEVTAVGSDRITIKQRDGSSLTIHVDKDTTFRIRKTETPTIADIKVGDRVAAAGPLRADGSMDANAVQAKRPRAANGERGQNGLRSPKPSTAPST